MRGILIKSTIPILILAVYSGFFFPEEAFTLIFQPPVVIKLGENPLAVTIGDFNADGVQDLAVANAGSNDISVLLGIDDGTFGPELRFSVGDGPSSLVVGDFDNDGNQDLAVANQGGFFDSIPDHVSVLLGQGDGNFDPEVRFRVDDQPFSVAVGDFNSDGNQDLATANFKSGTVSILLGIGDGRFLPKTSFGDRRFGLVSIVIGDFNEDEKEDLATSNLNTNDISIFLGGGNGNFGFQRRFRAGLDPASVVIGDFNNDGHQDLVAPNGFSATNVSVLLGNGNGTFDPQTLFKTGLTPVSVAIGDFNLDGRDDLAVANRDTGDLSLLLGKGDGSFRREIRLDVFGAPTFITSGDFDDDGREDLAVTEFFGNVNILLNRSPFPNRPPVSMAGQDTEIECSSFEGATVILDGSASTDPDSTLGTNDDIIFFEWFEDFRLPTERFLGLGEVLPVTLSLGPHLITLRITDSSGETDTDEVMVKVVDTTPPEISLSLAPSFLWPPNHRMVDIEALVSAADVCSIPAVLLESVKSNEPDDSAGMGDGHTVNDIQGVDFGTADFQFRLRAERSGNGARRNYTVIYRAIDSSGNVGSATSHVFVPHDMGGVTEPVMISAYENGIGTVAEWSEVPGALFYNVVRGEMNNLRETDEFIHLGQLTCIASTTTQLSTVGSEDPELPPVGEAFFYLVEYNDGLESGFGTESAAKPRFAPPGQGNCP